MKNFPLQILGKHDRVIATIEANVRDAEAYFRPLIDDPDIDLHGNKLIYKNVLASNIVKGTDVFFSVHCHGRCMVIPGISSFSGCLAFKSFFENVSRLSKTPG